MKSLIAKNGKKVQFKMSASPGSRVFVAGTFNQWEPTANPLSDTSGCGEFKASLLIPKGTHEYKFIVNGVWIMDPKSVEWSTNACGSLNNVLHV